MKTKEFLESKHSEHGGASEVWNAHETIYYGGSQFVKTYLWKYEGEENVDLQERRKMAAPENHFNDLVERREALVYSRKISRDVEAAQWQSIEENTDGRGTPWEQFVKKCFRLMQVYGFIPVLTDRLPSSEDAPTRAQDSNNLPYALPILPQNFTNWSVGRDGKLDWCVICTVRIESAPMAKVRKIKQYRLITREVIRVYEEVKEAGKKTLQLIDEIQHNVGEVPVVLLNDLDPKNESIVGLPSLQSSVKLSVLLFNYQSWHTQVLYKTNFSTLAKTPWPGGEVEKETTVGPGYSIDVPADGITPTWISPPTGPSDTFDKRTKDARRRIYELAKLDAGMGEDSARELSGEAYDRRHKATEDEARRLGKRMEEFEVSLADMLLRLWLKSPSAKIEINYPKRYGVRATADAVAQLKATEEIESLPQSVRAKLASEIVFTEDFANLTDAEQDAMKVEIESYDPEAVNLKKEAELAKAKAAPQVEIEKDRSKAKVESDKARAEADVKRAEIEAQKPPTGNGNNAAGLPTL